VLVSVWVGVLGDRWIGIVFKHGTENVLRTIRDFVESVSGGQFWVGEDGVGCNDWVVG
jgi:hypothetical protein